MITNNLPPSLLAQGKFGTFLLPAGDLVSETIATGHGWDLHIIPVLESAARRKGTAVDVGAHIGFFTILMSRAFEVVYAFEPQPFLFEYLKANVAINNATNVIAHPLALHSRAALMQLARSELQDVEVPINGTDIDYTGFSNFGAVAFESCGDASKAVAVAEAVMLDSFDLRDLTFLKCDCQGNDFDVLKGAEATIRTSRPLVVFESEPHLESRRGVEWNFYVQFFADMDYRILHLQEGRRDFLAAPREQSELPIGLAAWS